VSDSGDGEDRSFERLAESLIELKMAEPEEIRGCADGEVERISATAPFSLPADYVDFLRVMGRGAGRLFEGSWFFYPGMLEAPEAAQEIAAEPGESLTLDGRFFCGHHQGYQVYFFEEYLPAVYYYYERHSETPVFRVADSFTGYAWQFRDYLLKLREDNLRLFEERQRKREEMGLPREKRDEW
jgi:hypothetical protein